MFDCFANARNDGAFVMLSEAKHLMILAIRDSSRFAFRMTTFASLRVSSASVAIERVGQSKAVDCFAYARNDIGNYHKGGE